MRTIVPVFISIILILIIDFYTFKGLMLLLCRKKTVFFRRIIPILYFLVSLFFIITQIWIFSKPTVISAPGQYNRIFMIIGVFILFYLPKSVFFVFHLFEDIIWMLRISFYKLRKRIKPELQTVFIRSRKHGIIFISKIGAVFSIILFTLVLYGMVFGRFNYIVRSEVISFKELPESFNGLKVVQISDLHLGSYGNNKDKLNRAVQIVNSLSPDIVVFTGDMMNTYSSELDGWEEVLAGIKAKIGKYSIMGNHDYGDYVEWEEESDRIANIELLKNFHEKTGFELLENEFVRIERNNENIIIAGVENWGEPPFPQYGNLEKAIGELQNEFIILLSHDPSHWKAEILPKTDVNITLSGHTHGFQFGIYTGSFQWSPIQYKYPYWAGLYDENSQYLYVNCGLGFVAFPGRVGIRPEITLLEFRKD